MDKLSEKSSKPPRPKKPYVKPAIRYEKVFETTALTICCYAAVSLWAGFLLYSDRLGTFSRD